MFKKIVFRMFLLLLSSMPAALAQSQGNFDLQQYNRFLDANRDLTYGELYAKFQPARAYNLQIDFDPLTAAYLDSITIKYDLTRDELALIQQYGFMVTERLGYSFGRSFLDIYEKDLPVFVSTDAILFALHMSYDAILKRLEYWLFIPRLTAALRQMHAQWPALHSDLGQNQGMLPSLNDLDVYLTVARQLLEGVEVAPAGQNQAAVSELLALIAAERVAKYPLFNEKPRLIDFSQFKPRGHYTESAALKNYFRAMIWLGRTEMRLMSPKEPGEPKPVNVTREIIDAYLVLKCAEESGAFPLLDEIDEVIRFMVGESDNVTMHNLQMLATEISLTSPTQLLDPEFRHIFKRALLEKAFAFQRINSQILFSDPMNPEQLEPPSAFLLLGQRFLVDSFVLGSVVYDKIKFQDRKIWRQLPSSLDVLFVLGNDDVLPLLKDELTTYHYSSNLNALRYLVDSYGPDFWESTLVNVWLDAIRSLHDLSNFNAGPGFMKTGAWQQQKMNTQLASWAELRHDNLLYAKQSYSGGISCSYPFSYVEPYPNFYFNLKVFAERSQAYFDSLTYSDTRLANIGGFFANMATTMDTLASIAGKELSETPLTNDEDRFLKTMLFDIKVGCTTSFSGWYPGLFFSSADDAGNVNFLVADVHTAPTDAGGNMVGKVLHVGTGPVNMAVFVVEDNDGESRAYVGPLFSYYQHVTLNFQRLTDSEWENMFNGSPPSRPDWINVYLADEQGRRRPAGRVLVTSVQTDDGSSESVPQTILLRQNYPNPFNAGTLISFDVPFSRSGRGQVKLAVYNLKGQLVTTLVNDSLPPGTYLFRWDGVQANGQTVASGIYAYRLQVGKLVQTKKLTVLK